MVEYRAPLREMQFVLYELWKADQVWAGIPALEEVSRELADSVLEEAAKLAESAIAPLSRAADEEGVTFNDGNVTTPAGFKEAWKTYTAGGWIGLSGNPEFDGQGMPKMLSTMFEEMLHSASNAFCLYSILTSGAALAIDAHATPALKQKYLPRLYSGEWCAAMCLTESHAGTDLGMIRTKAEPQADGSFAITGTKIFITGGEQDLSDNIIHLVLARLPDAPQGSKGISMFLVPKIMVNDDESLGERNGVACGSIEHKMGIHASATCVMNFDQATGWLVGDAHAGLAAMFTMMNYERLSMGTQALGCSELALQKSRAYALDRIQSRSPDGAVNPDRAADPIIVHPDVRRMLLTQKAYLEGGRAFGAYVGMQLDIAKYGEGEAAKTASNRVALLTPVAKAFLSDKGLESCIAGQQIFGGHGYIREWGMEQLVRDVRIAQIYEGTNGIQALDLMGRKIVYNKGAFLSEYLAEVRDYASNGAPAEFASALKKACDNLEQLSQDVIRASDANAAEVGAASVDYLHVFGFTSLAFMWAKIAEQALQHEADDSGFYVAKLATARFFFARLLPQAEALSTSVRAGADSLMQLDAANF